MSNEIDLSVALGTKGFAILGGAASDQSGISVASAGDVNGDGVDDIIIGAIDADPSSRTNAGTSYVIYGSSANPGTIDLSVELGTKGFAIIGGATGDRSGWSVSSAGDVNGDGYIDIIIGARYADPSSRTDAGTSYVIYGSSANPGTIDLSVALGTKGFAILGGTANDQSGGSVASAGDVNNDGYDDIIISAIYADPSSRSNAGTSYVIYGSSANPGTIDLSVALGTKGFAILGGASFDNSGVTISSAGDVNGDGYQDIIIGAWLADPSSRSSAGKSYVIYGSSANPGTIDLSLALGTKGFAILGGAANDRLGGVSSAGDVNGDGVDDIIIGAWPASPSSRTEAGTSYVIYGSSVNPGTIDLSVALTSSQGFAILGGAANDNSGVSVSSAGDVNGDGYIDIIIGAYSADPSSRSNAGISYVIYGSSANPGTIDLSVALGTKGFAILGGATDDRSGISVSSAGDVNGDGVDDIIIGAYAADPSSRTDAGTSYVIYGSGIISPTSKPSGNPSSMPSAEPSSSPSSLPSSRPSAIPSSLPSAAPTEVPSSMPSGEPSSSPSEKPSSYPSAAPSSAPSNTPSGKPSSMPSAEPSSVPSGYPTSTPSAIPSSMPSGAPTSQPSSFPSSIPSADPSGAPSSLPSSEPSAIPSSLPSAIPTDVPSSVPSGKPTSAPSTRASFIQSGSLGGFPSSVPSSVPSGKPSSIPSADPSATPSSLPSSEPSAIPTAFPSGEPTSSPSQLPSSTPTLYPTNNEATPFITKNINEGGVFFRSTNKENIIFNLSSDITIYGKGGEAIFTISPDLHIRITIINFNLFHDVIDLRPFMNIYRFNELNITSGTLITFDDELQIYLPNIDQNQLHDENFIFSSIPSNQPTSSPSKFYVESDDHLSGSKNSLISAYKIGGLVAGSLAILGVGYIARANHWWPFLSNAIKPVEHMLESAVVGDVCKIVPEEAL